MPTDKPSSGNRVTKVLATGAIVLGVAAGSYGVAAAASNSTQSGTTPAASSTAPAAPPAGTTGPGAGRPWGGQRNDETALTGDALAKVKAVALDKVPGGSIVRVETDADGNAAYEAHMTRADGTPVTVYVDKSFAAVSVESR